MEKSSMEKNIIEMLVKELENMGIHASFCEVSKNNNVKRKGIMVNTETQYKGDVSPVIDIEDRLNMIMELPMRGVENAVRQYAWEIRDIAQTVKPQDSPANIGILASFARCRNRIFAVLVNSRWNDLTDVPHIPFADDLAIVFKIRLDETTSESGEVIRTAKVNMSMLKDWGVSEKDLLQAAETNALVTVEPMSSVLGDMVKDTCQEDAMPDMYIIRDKRHNTAGGISSKNILERFAHLQEANLLILPSSIYEVIVIPVKDPAVMDSVMNFTEMVKEVNQTFDKTEWLSDHAYIYRRETGCIECCE